MSELTLSQPLVPSVDAPLIHPVYVWKTGRQIFLSKSTKVVVDKYLETRSYRECVEALKRECHREISEITVKRWMELPLVRDYIFEKFEEKGIYNGWDKDHWFAVMTRHLMASSVWEQAREDIKSCESALGRNPKDTDAQVGLVNAKSRQLEASKDRLATGDLYAMKLIGQFKGWEAKPEFNFNQQINFTQANGKE